MKQLVAIVAVVTKTLYAPFNDTYRVCGEDTITGEPLTWDTTEQVASTPDAFRAVPKLGRPPLDPAKRRRAINTRIAPETMEYFAITQDASDSIGRGIDCLVQAYKSLLREHVTLLKQQKQAAREKPLRRRCTTVAGAAQRSGDL